MDLYSTSVLNGVAQAKQVLPVPSFFLSFFGSAIYHETEEVVFDLADDKPRISPFVHPMHEGKLVESGGYTSKMVKPAYIKDKRVHNPTKALKRLAGEPITGDMTNEQRLQAAIVSDIADQRRMLARRWEIMAGEALISGTQTIIGDGFNAVVDYQRDSGLVKTLTAGDKWDASTAPDIGGQIEDWDGLLADKCGFNTSHIIMDRKAWKLFKKNTNLKAELDLRRGTESVTPNIAPMLQMEGVSVKGYYGEYPIFVYNHKYIDPVDGQTKQVMPDNTVVLVSREGLQGVRHFGAIKDLKANIQARDVFVKSWEVEDPSARFLLMQSAPIMVPYNVNAALVATVA